MAGRIAITIGLAFVLLTDASHASAQSRRPLQTRDPDPVAAGHVALDLGTAWLPGTRFGAAGLEGDFLQLPRVAVRVGIGDVAEIGLETGVALLAIDRRFPAPLADAVEVGDSDRTTADILDPVVSTKVRLWREAAARPAVALFVATRLPVASNESGLGLDTTDVLVSLLAADSLGRTRVAANLGLGILGIPTRPNEQNDVVVYGLSVGRAVAPWLELVGEVSGRYDPSEGVWPGLEDSGHVLFGGRFGTGATRFDAGVLVGTTEIDPDLGFFVGVTRTFRRDAP